MHQARSPVKTNNSEFIRFLGWLTWTLVCIVTLGFSHKYRDGMYDFELMDSEYSGSKKGEQLARNYLGCPDRQPQPNRVVDYAMQGQDPMHAEQPGATETSPTKIMGVREESGPEKGMRGRQAREWDRLSTSTSIITAASAAALAIPGQTGPGSYWIANACFCAALGVSIEAVITIFYLQVTGRGVRTKTLVKLVGGRMKIFGVAVPAEVVAFVASLPMVLATYSSLYLLAGTVAMVTTSTWGPSPSFPTPCYYLSLAPIGLGFICMCCVAAVCEACAYSERKAKRSQRNSLKWGGGHK